MLRLTLQRKFFIALTVLLAALLAVFVGLSRLGLQRGLGQYVAEIELSRMDWLAKRLLDDYASHDNSWQFLKDDKNAWFSALMSANPRRGGKPALDRGEPGVADATAHRAPYEHFGPFGPPPFGEPPGDPGLGEPHGPPPGGAILGPGAPQLDVLPQRFAPPAPPNIPGDPRTRAGNVYNRMALLDASGQRHLAGNAIDAASAVKQPLRLSSRTVAYLALMPLQGIQTDTDRAFVAQQLEFIVIAALVGLLLALLISWQLAKRWLAPIQNLAQAAHAVAAGRLDTRVPEQGQDELATLAQTFNQMTGKLAAMESSRQQWLSDVAHELRTPLAAMRAEIEALQDGVRPFDAHSAHRLHRQVMRLGQLVDDLRLSLDQASGEPPLQLTPQQPLLLLLDALDLMRERFAQSDIALETGYLKPLAQQGHITMMADERRLHQVFINLLENSLRYTHAGGKLQICAGLEEGLDGQRLVLLLDDTAPCPEDADLTRLFDRFYRVDVSRNRQHGGSGLGLAICKAIVQAHGGSITASCSALGGLRIELSLPLLPANKDAQA
jgi:two-component system sensor histidine kinase BaeS